MRGLVPVGSCVGHGPAAAGDAGFELRLGRVFGAESAQLVLAFLGDDPKRARGVVAHPRCQPSLRLVVPAADLTTVAARGTKAHAMRFDHGNAQSSTRTGQRCPKPAEPGPDDRYIEPSVTIQWGARRRNVGGGGII